MRVVKKLLELFFPKKEEFCNECFYNHKLLLEEPCKFCRNNEIFNNKTSYFKPTIGETK